MKRFLGGFGLITGASYPWRTLIIFIKKPHLWRYLIVPIAINFVLAVILYTGGLVWGWQEIDRFTEQLQQKSVNLVNTLPLGLSLLEGLESLLQVILTIIFTILLLVIIGFILTQFGVFLGLPWYGKLSEELERVKTGQLVYLEVPILEDIVRSLSFEVRKLTILVSFGIPLLLMNLLPGGTILSSLGGVALSATLISLDFLNNPLERRRLSFPKKLQLLSASLPASAGFGLTCLALISVPLVNLVTIPLCVASGTLFFCDRLMTLLPLPEKP